MLDNKFGKDRPKGLYFTAIRTFQFLPASVYKIVEKKNENLHADVTTLINLRMECDEL